MFLKKLKLENFLSYGPDIVEIPLNNLNIIVGPNGSGKSNLLEAISLLRSTPRSLTAPIRSGGGIVDWLWKGSQQPNATISVDFNNNFSKQFTDIDINYLLRFSVVKNRFEILEEKIENVKPVPNYPRPYLYYSNNGHSHIINAYSDSEPRELKKDDIDLSASIFAQVKDPNEYPEITFLGKQLDAVRIYREWHFGVDCMVRQYQPADLSVSQLDENCGNLAFVLNHLLTKMQVRKKLQKLIKDVYDGADEVMVRIEGGRAITMISEDGLLEPITANRLSDGILRYLCLMAILLNPEPPPLICIDEPELGMHPDLIAGIADAIKHAAEKTQLIVTTHSTLLLDAFSDMPEVIRICEKHDGRSTIRQIPPDELKDWIEDYGGLGAVWRSGEMGGNRW
ncbi:MAG: AAA family ATPase [Victivallaceae bacterium]|nr:AAA family ATPase [Victivallaceae bacterium]